MSILINASLTSGFALTPDNSGAIQFQSNGANTVSISTTGGIGIAGSLSTTAPVTVTGATANVGDTDNFIIANRAGAVTLTFPAAASWTGRVITVKTVQAQTVVSASTNIVPVGSTSAGTAILAATAGKFATLVSDGTNWVIMQAN